MSKLQEYRDFLASVTGEPPKPKPKLDQLKEKLATADLPKQREVLAQSQECFHDEERRQLSPLERRKRFGRVIPLSAEELRQINFRDAVDAARAATQARLRQEREHLAQLNEFLKLY